MISSSMITTIIAKLPDNNRGYYDYIFCTNDTSDN